MKNPKSQIPNPNHWLLEHEICPEAEDCSRTVGKDDSNQISGSRTPDYPVALSLGQIGSEALTPSLSLLPVSGIGWHDSVLVTVSIPDSVANDPALNEDGDVLVAKLQLASDNPHVKTPTDILVKITLVHPTACLKTYDFITDASLADTINSTEVNVNTKGKVTSTNPYGSLSPDGKFGGFTSSLTEAGSVCGGSLVAVATPNPTKAPLSFTVK